MRSIVETNETMARAHAEIGNAFSMLARTFEKTEQRQHQLEATNNKLYENKGISPQIFLLVTGVLSLLLILGTIWITDTSIKATFTSFEAGRKEDVKKLQSSIDEAKEEVVVEELKDGH